MVRATAALPTTPVTQTRRQKMACDDIQTPPTPHRIELRNDTDEVDAKKPVNSFQPVPKIRRKLNNNNNKNQREEKNGEAENHKITEYFPVRRSVRKTKKIVLEEKRRDLEYALRNGIEDGLKVKRFEGKGRGVVAVKNFSRGDFVVEYSGDLIDPIEAKLREEKYAQDQGTGCYMYYFRHNDQQYCLTNNQDASSPPRPKLPTPNFGQEGNAMAATVEINSSVFKNPFIEAENAKEAILQKHVKMVETKDNTKLINGKKICWNYRKGRCRFGHNCKFAHDSDIQKTAEQIEKEKLAAVQNSLVCHNAQTGHSQYVPQNVTRTGEDSDEDAPGLKKKRKRPGLTQGLVPGKKVMKHYLRTQKT